LLRLAEVTRDFDESVAIADSKRPQATSLRSKRLFQPGIGPHTESQTVELVLEALRERYPARYGQYGLGVPYPGSGRQECDWCLGRAPDWDWSIEIKMLRFLGDNGKLNDNMLMRLLSPYPAHRSALTDCQKLAESDFPGERAILIYRFDQDEWSLGPAIDAFEILARQKFRLTDRNVAQFDNLVHPVHSHGRVFSWQIS
jgi:hypothetical protein